ncbi:uncharacterized protein N7446_009359 [Penicillium canescens]|uniref:Uncharacterized protein n=1 Tax=Penicillium canescens TaxID=5083 RepID=A0AAD6I692_PENCN|nr:uncharacterized protein N7446_009359 [Penicillium canescens]KAJ6034606.1 hypothetical protein N7460_008781 [Penicillium canescens]KAJ6046267.1 hypothetical protein N7444_007521 [Penicillium canescens]KAJ6053347.1 hypothetical protein N7446_009359 [Penicillium canescens]
MIRFRPGFWPCIVVSCLLIFLYFRLPPPHKDILAPLDLSPLPLPEEFNVLHPGEFTDPTTYPDIHIVSSPTDSPDEPEGEGTLNDLPQPRFYQGGILTLTTQNGSTEYPKPAIYDPYPAYNTPRWRKTWAGRFEACRGPRGRDLDRGCSEDMMSVYRGKQKGFPASTFGSHKALSLDQDVCVDRYARYGPYGIDENNDVDIPGFPRPNRVLWTNVNWGYLQSQCYERNAERYRPDRPDQHYRQHILSLYPPILGEHMSILSKPADLSYKTRSAVVLRASETMRWTPSHFHYLRSLIMELSLHTGSEYQVFFMIDVHDESIDLENDEEAVRGLKQRVVPSEFRNMTVLFSEHLLEQWYPKMGEHRAIYQHLQAMQVFARMYPEFDYYWQFEFDNRVIGHTYHFLEQAIEFARKQPRKYLWERNAYFYTPGAHGTWEDFSNMVANSMTGKHSVWGPVKHEGIKPAGPKPLPGSHPENDNFKWGVGEEADLITFLPIFDPRNTSWTFPNMTWNVSDNIPRRTSVITQWRMSKRLLMEMHNAQRRRGEAFASEMSAPSWALLHGFKAVHVPHPIYADGQWSPGEMARIFNRGSPDNINGGSDSIWNWDHRFDYLWYRISYMFATQAAEDLFRRWMGFQPDPRLYLDGIRPEYRPGRFWDDGGSLDEATNGRLCFPFMLLHNVKNTEPEKTLNLPVTDSALKDDAT